MATPEPPRVLNGPARIALRFLIFAAVAWVILQVGAQLTAVLIPVAVAILIAAILDWPVAKLAGLGLNRYVAAALVLLLTIAVVGGLMSAAIGIMVTGWSDLEVGVLAGLESLRHWLAEGPLGLGGDSMSDMLAPLGDWVRQNSEAIAGNAVRWGGSATSFLASALIGLVTILFFLADGHRIGQWFVRAVGLGHHDDFAARLDAGWHALTAYARTQIVVAAVDAVGIAAGAAILGVPFAVPIGVLVFLTAFIPMIGAILSGAVAVLIALATGGLVQALLMLAVVILVQQIESNVLAPLLLGTAVKIHPWGILIGVSTATFLAGLAGALFAAPVMAVVNAMFFSFTTDDPEEPALAQLPTEDEPANAEGPPPAS